MMKMMGRFCYKCGKTGQLYDGVCRECFLSSFSPFSYPKIARLDVCPKCGRVLRRGKWVDFDPVECLMSVLDFDDRFDVEGISVRGVEERGGKIVIGFLVKGSVMGLEIEEEGEAPIIRNFRSCDQCSRIAGGYYEAIVQIRAERRHPTPYECMRCELISREVASQSFVTKVEKLKEGIDIYVGNQDVGRKICERIVRDLGGRYSSSPKLVGEKDGRKVYRVTYSVRLPGYGEGDLVMVGTELFMLKRRGGRLVGVNVETGDVRYRISNGVRVGNFQECDISVVHSAGAQVKVIDPRTSEEVVARGMKVKEGERVRIVRTRRGIFYIPDGA